MDKVRAVIAREYTERVHNKWFVIATVFAPLLFAGIMIIPAWLAIRDRGAVDLSNVVIVDATDARLGDRLAEQLASRQAGRRRRPDVRVMAPAEVSAAESSLTRAVMTYRRSGYIVVDDLTLKGERARYAGRNATSLPAMDRIERAVRTSVLATRLEQAGVSRERAEDLSHMPLELTTERITDRGRGGSGTVNFFFAFGVAFLVYMSIMLYGQAIMRGVMEEKQTRVAEVVVSSVTPDALLAGKIIGVAAVWLTQLVIWFVTGVVIAKVRGPILQALGAPAMPFQLPSISVEAALLLAAFVLLGFGLYAALFAAVGSMVNTEQEAQQAAQPVMLMLVAAIVLIQPVIFNPTSTIAKVASWVPFTSPMIMPVRLASISLTWPEMLGTLLVLLVGVAGGVWIAARIYRVGLLMYGKRPTVRELGRWIRYA